MARSTRDVKLETRTARLKLPAGKYHWRGISKGLALGYWRGKKGGSWLVRQLLADGTYAMQTLGKADDHQDTDGEEVLDYFTAQDAAREKAGQAVKKARVSYTVEAATNEYLDWFKAHRKSAYTTEKTIRAHILPHFGQRLPETITTVEFIRWHNHVAKTPVRRRGKGSAKLVKVGDDAEAIRKRKVTANRVLAIFKAILNAAWRNGKIKDNGAWSRVKPFSKVEESRKVFLQEDQCVRAINTAQGAFRKYVQALLYTGARPGKELEFIRVRDFDRHAGTVHVPDSKTGARETYLTDEGMAFFEQLTAGRHPDEYMLVKDDGTPWGKNHYTRPMKDLVERAQLPKEATAYAFRHTFISLALKNGMNIKVLADSVGTSVRMIELHYAKFLNQDRRRMLNAAMPSFGLEQGKVKAIGGVKVAKKKPPVSSNTLSEIVPIKNPRNADPR